jgi:2-polyprenyl-3-methyl-5-hydroxy-6-metoxy-1,4-benzoquinol methylase
MKEQKITERLTPEQAAVYWNERHKNSDPWRAGGDRGIPPQANKAFYYVRLGLLVRLLVKHFGSDRKLRILDAGCGRGWLSSRLCELGHDVVGIDQSEAAILYAQTYAKGAFSVSSLDHFRSEKRFDAVVSMDVLYHVTEDDQWCKSIHALSQVLDDDGVLLFSDELPEESTVLGNYVIKRCRADYKRVLSQHNLIIILSEPYGVFSPASWFLCVRCR